MSKFQYTINFDDTNNKTFEINVDEKTFIIKDDDNVAAPEWTLLANNKCTHCPYNTDKVKYCPVAKNLSQAADTFGDKKSFTEVTVFVKTENRMYGKKNGSTNCIIQPVWFIDGHQQLPASAYF